MSLLTSTVRNPLNHNSALTSKLRTVDCVTEDLTVHGGGDLEGTVFRSGSVQHLRKKRKINKKDEEPCTLINWIQFATNDASANNDAIVTMTSPDSVIMLLTAKAAARAAATQSDIPESITTTTSETIETTAGVTYNEKHNQKHRESLITEMALSAPFPLPLLFPPADSLPSPTELPSPSSLLSSGAQDVSRHDDAVQLEHVIVQTSANPTGEKLVNNVSKDKPENTGAVTANICGDKMQGGGFLYKYDVNGIERNSLSSKTVAYDDDMQCESFTTTADKCEEVKDMHCGSSSLAPGKSEGHPPAIRLPNAAASKLHAFTVRVRSIMEAGSALWRFHARTWRRGLIALALLLYATYFVSAMVYSFGDEGSIRLLWITCLAVVCLGGTKFKKFLKSRRRSTRREMEVSKNSSVDNSREGCSRDAENGGDEEEEDDDYGDGEISLILKRHGSMINWIIVGLMMTSVTLFVIVDVTYISGNPYNLVSAVGIIVYIVLFWIFSQARAKVRWRPVCWGFCLQLIFALVILRTQFGFKMFEWIGDRVSSYFTYADEGSAFIFGPNFRDHFFVFKVMPTVVFFSSTVSVLYQLGIMHVIIDKVAWVMQVTMGTTAGESLTAAANIFLSQTEAPLLIRPFLPDMTASELHAVMTGGFATITGGIMAAYILFGVPPNHLISASVMSAPASLAMSKLICPETETSKTTVKDLKKFKTSRDAAKSGNIIEAMSNGAVASIKLIASVVVNLIAFIATLHLINAILTWVGNRIGIEALTFQMICSYLLWPFAVVMGVELVDCRKVAQLIGIKTFLNEFIAYQELGVLIDNRKLFYNHVINMNGTWYQRGDDIYLVDHVKGAVGGAFGVGGVEGGVNSTLLILANGFLTERSIAIATYALCGFSNICSMGIVIGMLVSMVPERKSVLVSNVFSAMISGNVACFITACVAGNLNHYIAIIDVAEGRHSHRRHTEHTLGVDSAIQASLTPESC